MINNLPLLALPGDEAAASDTPPERLAELLEDSALRSTIAANPAATSAILEKLSQDEAEETRRLVALNPNTPWSCLLDLAREFPEALLANPVLPFLQLAHPHFLQEMSGEVWLHLLRCERLPHFWLNWLSNTHVKWGWNISVSDLAKLHVTLAGEAHAMNIRPADLYGHHLHHSLRQDMELIARLERTPVELLEQLASDPDWEIRARVAANPQTPPELLEQLAIGSYREVRKAVTRSPNTSIELLRYLASDGDWAVRRAVARHQQIPVELLECLAVDLDRLVRKAVAAHARTPVELLARLAGDRDREVRWHVADHPRASEEILRQLASDPEPSIRWRVAVHPRTPVEALLQLGTDPEWRVRLYAASHSHAPTELLARLISDPNEEVKMAVVESLIFSSATQVQVFTARFSRSPSAPHSYSREQTAELEEQILSSAQKDELIQYLERRRNRALHLLCSPRLAENLRAELYAYFFRAWRKTWSMVDPDSLSEMKLSSPLLRFFAGSPYWTERYQVAIHPTTPLDVLERLTHDGICYVRAAARWWLKERSKGF